MNPERLKQYLEFYQDLGVKTIYKRPATEDRGQGIGKGAAVPVHQPEPGVGGQEPWGGAALRAGTSGTAPGAPELPPMAPAGDTLRKILEDIGDCRRCRLHEGRNKLVFGVGNEKSPLVFVGEGPGADEDAQGIPFVGRAGQLLTQMIENTARKEGIPLERDEVYICNVVKCRPPGNRTPEPDEMEICGSFLYRQITTIHPKAICALGGTAARALTGHKEGVTKMRGRWFEWHGIPVMVTYHPSYLLRPYNQDAKREAWEDLKKILHFVYD